MFRTSRSLLLSVVLLSLALPVTAEDIPLTNWPVPSTAPSGRSVASNADLSGGTVFVAVTPCRVVDTRNPAGPYGGPAIGPYSSRNFDVDNGPCLGIPTGAASYSLNITVTDPQAAGHLTVWPTGGTMPTVSTLNYLAGQTIPNAAIVPASSGGAISIFSVAQANVIVDINGYFMDWGGDLNDGVNLQWHGNTGNSFMWVRNWNTAAASSGTRAITGIMSTTQNGPWVVAGVNNGVSGKNYGVVGQNDSTTSLASGVLGISDGRANTPTTWTHSGVLAESFTGNGLVALTNAAGAVAVIGQKLSSTGVEQTTGYLGYSSTSGVHAVGNITATGTKSFVEPHPVEAGKAITYIALEGPEAGTYFRGRGRFVGGQAVIDVPDSFRYVTDEEGLTVHVTPLGRIASVGVVQMNLSRIIVESTRDVEFSYIVYGVRKGFTRFEPIAQDRDYFVPRSPEVTLDQLALSEEHRARLIANGTFNEDGTVNMETARDKGWAKMWVEQKAVAGMASDR